MKKSKTAGATPTAPAPERLRLADLKPHPDQNKYFPSYGPGGRDALMADIAANGLRQPIEVLPAGNAAGLPPLTIVAGHNRRDICLELGWETALVLVRYDLADAPRAAVDRAFLTDNVARRQMDPLDRARAAVGLRVAERELAGRRVHGNPLDRPDVRERVGAELGMSGRNLGRYMNVLAAPPEVQAAFQAGRVKLVDAARVKTLPRADQERLAARLRAGEDPRAVFAEAFPPRARGHVKPADAVAALARGLEAAGADLAGRVAAVRPVHVRVHVPALRRGRKLIRALLDTADADGARGGPSQA